MKTLIRKIKRAIEKKWYLNHFDTKYPEQKKYAPRYRKTLGRRIRAAYHLVLYKLGWRERYIIMRPHQGGPYLWDMYTHHSLCQYPRIKDARREKRRLIRQTFRFHRVRRVV